MAVASAADGAANFADYVADISDAVEPFLQRWSRLLAAHASPFHSLPWLRSWYATLGASDGRRPLLLGVRRRDGGADVMLLALASRRSAGTRLVEFADATVVDYNLPLLAADWAAADGAASPATASARAMAICAVVRRALAANHDVLRLQKMPRHTLDAVPPVLNPLLLGLPARRSPMFGTQVHVPGSWDDWRRTLDKRVRKEFERSWRVFTRSPQARFERITDPAAALAAFNHLQQQQAQRMHDTGQRYLLDQPAYQAFYRQLVNDGLADGSVVLTALRDGPALVAVQLGVANRQRYIALRLSSDVGAWKHCSPGRLCGERSGWHLHQQGLRWFDFGIGDYAHKQVLQGAPIALFDVCEPLSWRGRPWVWAWQLRQRTKRGVRLPVQDGA